MKKKIVCLLSVIALVICLVATYHCFAIDTTCKFSDVPKNEWYAESIDYAYENGFMNGMTQTTFEPQTSISRGMIVTIIHRMEGSPKTAGELNFVDVNSSYYYCEPIKWASQNGIVNGIDKENFAPDVEITREQFATILYRYVISKGVDLKAGEQSLSFANYADKDKISEYAVSALTWANENGLIKGVTTTMLEPQGKATRAQAATIFMRFDKLLKESVKADASSEKSDEKANDNKDNETTEKKPSDKEDLSSSKDNTPQTTPDSNNNQNNNQDKDENTGEWDDVMSEPDKNEDIKDNEGNKDEENVNNKDELPTTPTIYIDDVSVNGKYADVVISVINNPGIASLKFDVNFDDEKLKLVSVNFDSSWGDYITAPTPYKNPQTINMISPFENIEANGKLAVLRFELLDDTIEEKIIIKCDESNIFDSDFNDVEFETIDGKINKQ